MKNSNTPAAPTKGELCEEYSEVRDYQIGDYSKFQFTGLTKREYFAGLAMQAMLSSKWYDDFCNESSSDNKQEVIAQLSIANSDALLAELEKA